jgi:hypothetical protein
MNKLAYFIFLLCFSYSAAGDDSDFAYLILQASVIDGVNQPKLICLHRRNRCTHVKADEPFIKIKPGAYRLDHIDFSKKGNSRYSITLKRPDILEFRKGKVYIIGNLELRERSPGKFKMEIRAQMELVKKACNSIPKSVIDFPFANAINGKELALSCNNVLQNT